MPALTAMTRNPGLKAFAEVELRALFETSAREGGSRDVAAIHQTLAAQGAHQ